MRRRNLSEEAMERGISCLREFGQRLQGMDPARVVVFATFQRLGFKALTNDEFGTAAANVDHYAAITIIGQCV